MSAVAVEPLELGALAVVAELFGAFHAAGIEYCHWKSNEHLVPALVGKTDLDILVGRASSVGAVRVLAERGYKRIAAVPERAYPGVEDYLGFDPDTGRLAHVHLHHQLVLGERHLKGYRLPWEAEILAARQFSRDHGAYVCDPNLELLLLGIRAALKVRSRDRLIDRLGKSYVRGGMRRELEWLVARLDPERFLTLAGPLVGPAAARHLLDAVSRGTPNATELLRLRRLAVPKLDQYRTFGSRHALAQRWSRELSSRGGKALQRWRGGVRATKHTLPYGGVFVALLGSDGSGKSTVSTELRSWLSWKLDVIQLYFGSGQGPVSWFRRPLTLAKSVRRGRRARNGGAVTEAREPKARGPRGLRGAWWALSIAGEKRARLAQARQARNQGLVVVADRFPQRQIEGFTDGPRLGRWLRGNSKLLRAVAAYELEPYLLADRQSPDLVIKLDVTPEVAFARRPDSDIASLTRRVEAVRQVTFGGATRVVQIDATQPLEQVLLEVKRAVWDSL